MAAHRFLVCHILPLISIVTVQALQYGQKGSETTLAPRIPGTPDKILWKQAFRRVVEFDGSEESVHGTFRDRVVLDWHTASLTVRDLQGSDSGPYELEATINNKKYYSQHEVAVIDKVAAPTISCLLNGSEDSAGDPQSPRALARLRCVAEGPPSLLSYSWTLLSGAHPGPELPVVLDGKQDQTVYSCRAANPVSEETGSFVAKDCYPDTFSTTALIISLIVLGLFLVLLVGCFVGYRRWKKAHPEPSYGRDVEQQPLKSSNGPDHGGVYDKDPEATLPSTQRLPLLTQEDLAPRSGSDQDEGEPTGSGRWGDATLVREDSTGPKPRGSPRPPDSGSEGSAGDPASEPERADLESECCPPTPPADAAPSAGRGCQPAAAQPDATQTLESANTGAVLQPPGEPEPPGTPPAVVSVSESPQDAAPSTSPEDLQSASLEATDRSANSSPSPTPSEPTSGARPGGHLDSDEGRPAARADAHLRSRRSSSEDVRGEEGEEEEEEEKEEMEEEEKEEHRGDAGWGCSGTREEVAANDEPNWNIEEPASEMEEEEEEEEVANTRGTDGESDEERGAAKEVSGGDGPLGSLTAQTPQNPDSDAAVGESAPDRGEEDGEDEEEEETSDTPGDKHQTADDGAGPVPSPAETKLEPTERREGEEDHQVPETSREDPQGPEEDKEEEEEEEDDGRDGAVSGPPAPEPESRSDSEEESQGSPAGQSAEEHTVHAPEDQRDRTEDAAGQKAPPAEIAMETPERAEEQEEEEGGLSRTTNDEAEEEEDDAGEEVVARLPASEPETRRSSGGVAEDGHAGPSTEEDTLDAHTPVKKDEEEEGHKLLGQEEDEEEEEGGREDDRTSQTQTQTQTQLSPGGRPEPGESAAGQEETQDPRGIDEGTKDQTKGQERRHP